jgi:endonuclease YncB( thermonuclease family)
MKFIIILLALFSSQAAAETCQHPENGFNCVGYVRNYDGDTITFDIPNVHPLINVVSIRVLGLDTPEIKGKSECEKRLALQAKKLVKNNLSAAKRIDLRNCVHGKYFRFVCDVIADGENISQIITEYGFAYQYTGGTKKDVDWCRREKQINK